MRIEEAKPQQIADYLNAMLRKADELLVHNPIDDG